MSIPREVHLVRQNPRCVLVNVAVWLAHVLQQRSIMLDSAWRLDLYAFSSNEFVYTPDFEPCDSTV